MEYRISCSTPDLSPALVSPDAGCLEEIDPLGQPLKLGLMASGTGSNFVAIADAIAQHRLAAQIQLLIYNNPEAPVAQRAQERHIPAYLINHRDFAARETFDQQIADRLRAADVEWVVMVGWMRRVTSVLIEAFPDHIINIHPSLLPSFPGIRAVEQALAHQVKISGCTVHIVRLEVDSGPILMQAAVPVFSNDTPSLLHQRIQTQEHQIIVQTIAQLAQAKQTSDRQHNALG
ncbi:phosphoribosylglycinamide formyltransferase [Acaryochloris sp. IP29b_bin.137]|uniref:phosphoribosylglycinamide formyltransferase n=1 Tax=Acaryochloris sp. IP29b_bin.137 TaxID=2969217 RepID=UPI0026143C93|nr:phosphoribosylglycinamide formyltransferase [Acaryochloris sp. IP29b_bin.137]